MSVLLIVDSDPNVCEFAETAFPLDHCVIGVPSWSEALDVLQDITFDLILIDIKLEGLYEHKLLEKARHLQECPLLIFAEGQDSHLQTLAQSVMADGYVEKILDADHILKAAQSHLANQAHSFPEGMSHSSCKLEISAFNPRLSDTHKFVRKRSQTSASMSLLHDKNAPQENSDLLESSSSSL